MSRLDLEVGDTVLGGDLVVPDAAPGVVVFAHGSGSSRKSPRIQRVARQLQQAGLATLLMDLLTEEEEAIDRRTRHLRFDVRLLARRLIGVIDFLSSRDETAALPVGLFAANTGTAAALVAAAERPRRVRAVVSRGGRPDLAWGRLREVRSPTLLLVGSEDAQVLQLNRRAMNELGLVATLHVVPGADPLFEAPGTLDRVIEHATSWLGQHLRRQQGYADGASPAEDTRSPIR